MLPDSASDELRAFLKLCFSRDPVLRPTAAALLRHPFIIGHPSVLSKVTTITEDADVDPESAAVADAAKARGRVSKVSRQQVSSGAASVVPAIISPAIPLSTAAPVRTDSVALPVASAAPRISAAPLTNDSVALPATSAAPRTGTGPLANPYGRSTGIRSRTSSPPRRSAAAASPDVRIASSAAPLSVIANHVGSQRAPPSASPLLAKPPTHSLAGSILATPSRLESHATEQRIASPVSNTPLHNAARTLEPSPRTALQPHGFRLGSAVAQDALLGVVAASPDAAATAVALSGKEAAPRDPSQPSGNVVTASGGSGGQAAWLPPGVAAPAQPLGIHSRWKAEFALIDGGSQASRGSIGPARAASSATTAGTSAGGQESSTAMAPAEFGLANESRPPPPGHHHRRTVSGGASFPSSASATLADSTAHSAGAVPSPPMPSQISALAVAVPSPSTDGSSGGGSLRKTPKSGVIWPFSLLLGGPSSAVQDAPTVPATDLPAPVEQVGGSPESTSTTPNLPNASLGWVAPDAAAAGTSSSPTTAPQFHLLAAGLVQTPVETLTRVSLVAPEEDVVHAVEAAVEMPRILHRVRARQPQSAALGGITSRASAVAGSSTSPSPPGGLDSGSDDRSVLAAIRAAVAEDVRLQQSRVQANGDSIARSFDSMLKSFERPSARSVSAAQRIFNGRVVGAGAAIKRGTIAGVGDTVIEEGDEEEQHSVEARGIFNFGDLTDPSSAVGGASLPPLQPARSTLNLGGVPGAPPQSTLSRPPASSSAPLLHSLSSESNDDEAVPEASRAGSAAAAAPAAEHPQPFESVAAAPSSSAEGPMHVDVETDSGSSNSVLTAKVSTEEAPAAFVVSSPSLPPMVVSVTLGQRATSSPRATISSAGILQRGVVLYGETTLAVPVANLVTSTGALQAATDLESSLIFSARQTIAGCDVAAEQVCHSPLNVCVPVLSSSVRVEADAPMLQPSSNHSECVSRSQLPVVHSPETAPQRGAGSICNEALLIIGRSKLPGSFATGSEQAALPQHHAREMGAYPWVGVQSNGAADPAALVTAKHSPPLSHSTVMVVEGNVLGAEGGASDPPFAQISAAPSFVPLVSHCALPRTSSRNSLATGATTVPESLPHPIGTLPGLTPSSLGPVAILSGAAFLQSSSRLPLSAVANESQAPQATSADAHGAGAMQIKQPIALMNGPSGVLLVHGSSGRSAPVNAEQTLVDHAISGALPGKVQAVTSPALRLAQAGPTPPVLTMAPLARGQCEITEANPIAGLLLGGAGDVDVEAGLRDAGGAGVSTGGNRPDGTCASGEVPVGTAGSSFPCAASAAHG